MTALSREPSERAFRMAALNRKRVSWWSEINRRHKEKKYQNMLVGKWIQLVSTCMSTVNKRPQNERRMSEVNLESPWTEVSFKISIAVFTFPTCFFWPWKLTLWEVVSFSQPPMKGWNSSYYLFSLCCCCILVWLAADSTPDPLLSIKQRATAHSDQMNWIMSSHFKFKSAVRWHATL